MEVVKGAVTAAHREFAGMCNRAMQPLAGLPDCRLDRAKSARMARQ